MNLLVFEADPAHRLTFILVEYFAGHGSGWQIVSGNDKSPDFDLASIDAALISEADQAAEIALSLRKSGMIGLILTLAGADQSIAAPVVKLTKPLRLAALLAKLEAPGEAAIDGAVVGSYYFDAGARALVHGTTGTAERLTDKEAVLLGLLLRAPQGLAREALQEAAFGYAAGTDTHTVETHIWRLRQKLETDPSAPVLLLTEGNLYKLTR